MFCSFERTRRSKLKENQTPLSFTLAKFKVSLKDHYSQKLITYRRKMEFSYIRKTISS